MSPRIPLAIMIALAGFSLAMVVKAVSAKAHGWYPIECCSGMDCAPVEKVEIRPAEAFTAHALIPPAYAAPSAMVVTTKHGTAIVPGNFPRRESKDGQLHACMRPAKDGGMKLLCIFFPPAM